MLRGKSRGRASADIDRIGYSVAGGLSVGLHMLYEGVCIPLVHFLALWDKGIEIAVSALRATKGDMNIDAKLF